MGETIKKPDVLIESQNNEVEGENCWFCKKRPKVKSEDKQVTMYFKTSSSRFEQTTVIVPRCRNCSLVHFIKQFFGWGIMIPAPILGLILVKKFFSNDNVLLILGTYFAFVFASYVVGLLAINSVLNSYENNKDSFPPIKTLLDEGWVLDKPPEPSK